MEQMADRLFLTYQLRGFSHHNMLRHFEKAVRLFPFSKLSPTGFLLRVGAVNRAEPPVFERILEDGPTVLAELPLLREFMKPDTSVEIEAKWDLWQFHGEFKLTPTPVTLSCFGPEFDDGESGNLEIDFGLDELYLPQTEHPGAMVPAQSNVRSLLRLVHELDNAMASESRRLWTESGENFASRLESVLKEASV